MMIAMPIMRMMQMPIHQIIHMVPMRYQLMSTTLAMHMLRLVAQANMRSAACRIRRRHLNHMLVEMVAVRAVQVSIMQIIGVISMLYCRVPATFTMDVGMQFVNFMMVSHDGHLASTIRVTLFMANRRETYRVSGMDCAEEVSLLRRALSGVNGVYELGFDVVNGKMTIEFDEKRISAEAIAAKVVGLGMRLEAWVQLQQNAPTLWAQHGRKVLAAASAFFLLLGVCLIAYNTGHFTLSLLAHEHGEAPVPLPAIISFCLAMAFGAFPTLQKAIQSIAALRPDMSALMLLCICGASFLGEWMEGATVAFLFSLANLLEAYSMQRARNAISSLLGSAPKEATVVHAHGEHKMLVAKVQLGETIRVRPGDTIPFDGDVLQGVSSVINPF